MKKAVEPLLLVPIGFGCTLVNTPLSELMRQEGLLRTQYGAGIASELFPLLIFVGIGAMADFGPLLENPRILPFGAAGQVGIFLTLLLALALGLSQLDAVAIAVIGACDGPTAIYVASQYATDLLGPIPVAVYSYMALAPIIQPPIMKAPTNEKERVIRMAAARRGVSPQARLLFPVVVHAGGRADRVQGAAAARRHLARQLHARIERVARLTEASENEIANIVPLFLGLAIGGTMEGHAFLKPTTLAIFALGFIAIGLDTVAGVLFGKLVCALTGGKVNPLIGAAGISAYPMAARVVQAQGLRF